MWDPIWYPSQKGLQPIKRMLLMVERCSNIRAEALLQNTSCSTPPNVTQCCCLLSVLKVVTNNKSQGNSCREVDQLDMANMSSEYMNWLFLEIPKLFLFLHSEI